MSAQILPFQRDEPVVFFKERNRTVEPAAKRDPVVERCEKLFQDARAYRDEDLRMADRWRSSREWVLSNGLHMQGFGGTHTHVNLIAEKINKLAADVTEADPAFNFRAPTPESVQLAEHLNLSIPATWEQNRGSRKYRSTVKASLIFGTWFMKVHHVPALGGRGPETMIREVPCYRFFPAPYASDPETAPFVIEVTPRTVESIYAEYGVRVPPELEPDADFPDIGEDLDDPRGRNGIIRGTNLSAGATELFPPSFLIGDKSTSGIVFQKEMWINDASMESRYWIENKGKGPELAYGKDKKYKHGRLISWANGVKLYDTDAPYARPYVRFIDNPFPQFMWGLGEVPALVNLQLLHDDTVDNMRLIHAFMAFPRTIIDKSTGLRDGELTNDPSEIWWTNRGTHDRIKVMPATTPPPEYYSHVAKVEQWFDLITGSFDVTRGVNPSGVTAARALVALQRAAGIRVRERMREHEDSLTDVGRMMAERIQQFGDTNAALPDPSGKGFREFFLTEDDRTAPFNLKVDITSRLQDIKDLEFQKLLLMSQMGMVLPQRLLKDSGLSNTSVLLAELPEAIQMAQAMAAAQAGSPNTTGAAQQVAGSQRAISKGMRTPMGEGG